MCCKLWVNNIGYRQQFLRAHQVGNVGVDLAAIHREARHSIDLRTLDFRIPIRTFHQAHHEFAIATTCQIDQVINHERATFLVSLHHKAYAFKTFEIFIESQRFHQVERQFQTIGLFRVDIQTDVVLLRQHQQFLQQWQQFIHGARTLRARITWMQSRQFDGNTWTVFNTASV